MRRKEAQRLVEGFYLYEYLKLPDAVLATEVGVIPFYEWLEQNHSEALDFQLSGASRQPIIAGWIEDISKFPIGCCQYDKRVNVPVLGLYEARRILSRQGWTLEDESSGDESTGEDYCPKCARD